MATDAEKLKRLEAFVKAAQALNENFGPTDPLLNCGYPEHFYSFDEMLSDAQAWLETVTPLVKESK